MPMCVRWCQCKSPRLMRVHNQHSKAMFYSISGILGDRTCGVMTTVSMGLVANRVKARWRRATSTSDCAKYGCLWLILIPCLVMGRMCVGVNGFCRCHNLAQFNLRLNDFGKRTRKVCAVCVRVDSVYATCILSLIWSLHLFWHTIPARFSTSLHLS